PKSISAWNEVDVTFWICAPVRVAEPLGHVTVAVSPDWKLLPNTLTAWSPMPVAAGDEGEMLVIVGPITCGGATVKLKTLDCCPSGLFTRMPHVPAPFKVASIVNEVAVTF